MAVRRLAISSLLLVLGACGGDDAPATDAATGPTIDASTAPDAGAAPDTNTTPDATQSCLADNGWPMSTLPGNYTGEGYTAGENLVLPGAMVDQFGKQVNLEQFHGAMLLVHLGTVWGAPSQQLDSTRQTRESTLNGGEFVYREITVLLDDNTPGADASSGYALQADAAAWASSYSITGPVLAGLAAWQLGQDANVQSLPTLLIIDPTFEVANVIEGNPGDTALESAVNAAWTTFKTANPAYVFNYCTE